MAVSVVQSGAVTSDYTAMDAQEPAAGKAVKVKINAGATNNVVLIFDTRSDLASFVRDLSLAANAFSKT